MNCPFSDGLFNYRNIPKLTENPRELCDGPVYEGELYAILKKFPKYSTPGSYGLTGEFYIKFGENKFVIYAVQESYEYSKMTISKGTVL